MEETKFISQYDMNLEFSNNEFSQIFNNEETFMDLILYSHQNKSEENDKKSN